MHEIVIATLGLQVDVECEYGYERHNEECRPIYGLEGAKCTVLDRDNYVISETKHRLIDGDSCKNLSDIIGDTDGKGNLPGGHHGRHSDHGHRGATLFFVMLVRGLLACAFCPFTLQYRILHSRKVHGQGHVAYERLLPIL